MPRKTRRAWRIRGDVLKILSFLNWLVLGSSAVLALLYAVVCLMMLPYPELVADAGGGLAETVRLTLVLTAFTAVAAVATWLLQKRHRRWPQGQAALVLALIGLLVFVVATR
ncbi:hypothetical protein SAOR_08660 [Salinisphaera orenii MK-B5]|uniref:Uncharacterized protein n=1 Tax=Salinisphaera orenii MK-B5 TaxID=856730 RepID=A0A423PPA6_9GAMM|nr:hypothetical protein [Salinisphaera orenii]ROO27417.1 hypothetical protein SAOR_08660 [Salinisphaera orenii MK-B5]